MSELDHVLCTVGPDDAWAERLTADGWDLDAGTAHPGQGTRNRRLVLAGHHLELAWIEDRPEARANPLRLDRRADRATTGASPVGIGLRGRLAPEEPAFWLHADLGLPILVRRDDARRPGRPWSSCSTYRPATLPEQSRLHVRCSACTTSVPPRRTFPATPVRASSTARATSGWSWSSTPAAPSR